MNVLIAIDDTDNEESIGTGRLARMLADELVKEKLLQAPSVTRHQFLVHPDIPYTSHNSCACVGARQAAGVNLRMTINYAVDFLDRNFHEGADPGLCIANEEEVPRELVDFGLRAQREVIQPDEARLLAERLEIFTWCRGEPWRGAIGAMGGVGLRSTGCDGRFIGLEGIREISGIMNVKELLSRTGIQKVAAASGTSLRDDDIIDTRDWVRPVLQNHEIILFVDRTSDGMWRPIGGKKKDKKKK
ncbi:MAG: hypothetical protein C4520_20335 [Candidatus Abyssobacteria bacterium SURF_5]|uniref:Uncharacterized protein n=1 Tax=Abyssobacteria bacterium (strain SURF_5) TaxID=2093360 RepID=A0A3A4N6C8_ABYX5|nr:MAG: hypothetical protein C4520_20335 [Candidatus Abyssubacteria bacterium SURF_5]